MEKLTYKALKGVILGDLHQAQIYLDAVEFKELLAEIKEIIRELEAIKTISYNNRTVIK